MSNELASKTLGDLSKMHANILTGLARTDRKGRAMPQDGSEHLKQIAATIENELINLICGSHVDAIRALEVAMESHSARALQAVPLSSGSKTVSSIAWEAFLRWGQTKDLELLHRHGLVLGPKLDHIFQIGRDDPAFRAAALALISNGPSHDFIESIWLETRDTFWVGEPQDVLDLLMLEIEHHPKHMTDVLHQLVHSNDALGAEVLFVAGVRPRPGEPLVPQDAACLPGGFIDRAKSSHGQLAALQDQDPLCLIKSYRNKVPMF